MIDEFQDTSLYQWRNLLPLVENGLAQGAEAIILAMGSNPSTAGETDCGAIY
jgi:hypothetical protein